MINIYVFPLLYWMILVALEASVLVDGRSIKFKMKYKSNLKQELMFKIGVRDI